MTDLERRLAALGHELAWPPTPDVATQVRARIAADTRQGETRRAERTPRGARWWSRPLPAFAAVAVALVVAAAALLAASPGVRADLRRLLGIGAVKVEIVRELPPLRAGSRVDLGTRITAAEARLDTGRDAPAIGELGPPDAIFLGADPPGTLTAAYRPRRGLPERFDGLAALVSSFQGDPFGFVGKLVGSDTPIRRVRVDGAPGLWVPGAHGVLVADRDHAPTELRPRLASSTLLWLRDGITYRLEADVPLPTALRLARSVG
jgi:hypothetical protein